MTIIVAGDFCDNGRVASEIKQGSFSCLFSDVKPVVESADYSLVNFEFPVVDGDPSPIEKCGPCLIGQKKAIDAIKYAGFKCATLANNHILDHGEANCLNTKALLEAAGVDTVGAGKNMKEAGKVLYNNIKGETLAVINCCEHEFSIATETTAGANALNPVQQYYAIKEAREKADYVLVVVHGGTEHFQLPSLRMQETYRFFIDAGADAVVNHHQHCYSGYEVYNGKPIFYGIGNFCFDYESKRNSIWNEGYMVDLKFEDTIQFNLIPYVQCNDEPVVRLLTNEESKRFKEDIDKLNKVIADPSKLREAYQQRCKSSEDQMLMVLSPYTGRIAMGLARRKLLPLFLGKKRIARILNFVECESHREKMVHALKNALK